MFGTVVEVDGDRVTLELSPGVTGQWTRHSIAMLVLPPIDDGVDGAPDDEYEDEEYDEDPEGEFEESDGEEDSTDADEAATEVWEGVVVPNDASSLTRRGRRDPTLTGSPTRSRR